MIVQLYDKQSVSIGAFDLRRLNLTHVPEVIIHGTACFVKRTDGGYYETTMQVVYWPPIRP